MLLDLRSLEEVTATTAANYYSGGFANAQRLTRGLGWVTGAILLVLLGH